MKSKREEGYENPRRWRMTAKRQMNSSRHKSVWGALVDSTMDHGPVVEETWDQLAELAGVGRQWVKVVVRELIRDGLAVPVGDCKGGSGRPRRLRLRLPENPKKGDLWIPKGGSVDPKRGICRPPTGESGYTGKKDATENGGDRDFISDADSVGLSPEIAEYLEVVAARAVANAASKEPATPVPAEKIRRAYGC